jgi:hypothetical protein
MEQYTIISVRVGHFLAMEKSTLIYQMNYGRKLEAPIII